MVQFWSSMVRPTNFMPSSLQALWSRSRSTISMSRAGLCSPPVSISQVTFNMPMALAGNISTVQTARFWRLAALRAEQTRYRLQLETRPTCGKHALISARRMAALGRGCGKTRLQRMVGWLRPPMRCGPSANLGHLASDCLQQRCDTEDRDHPLHVVGQNVKAHLGSHLIQRPGQEVAAAHP